MASASATSDTSSGIFDKITFIGTGKMAQAMIDPLITNGFQPAEKVSVYDVSTKSMEDIESRFPGIQTSESIGEAVHAAECIVLAVKPQNINESFWDQFPLSKTDSEDDGSSFKLREDATLVSILAGM
jgi:pyrroline-5-carboxylate reductase